VYSSNIININGLNIMVTLISVYFEYIKILCKIFTKYIVPILQVYPNHLLYLLKLLQMTFIIIIIIIIICLY
jgi:hypothetical protein